MNANKFCWSDGMIRRKQNEIECKLGTQCVITHAPDKSWYRVAVGSSFSSKWESLFAAIRHAVSKHTKETIRQ